MTIFLMLFCVISIAFLLAALYVLGGWAQKMGGSE